MMLVEETSVPTEALPVPEFRDHLRLGSGFSDDTLQDSVLESFLRAAISAVEARTGKVVFQQTFVWTVYDWRTGAEQGLPVAPVSEILDITLEDAQGSAVVVASSAYRLVSNAHTPSLKSVSGRLPTIPRDGSAAVRFEAGYGPDWGNVPADLRQAVLLLAAHYYEFRQETTLSEGCMPFGVVSLLERYRPMRLSVGGVA
ncbi:head-tail connector protein [Shimia sagamensis]|uniref:Phage gp6-like head-tail connector protein n=1 Tax=Shimia sagamensis TaxID=1566352 RepID=A0ABY1NKP9_9RHOB|nr:head-tail connector protein [Shimia sagamensis]SMP11407.1 phage conserved hypothetical protein, phiE125 gp8 family [Shimia sagamensis]